MCRLLAFAFNNDTDREEKISCINSFKKLAITGGVLDRSSPGHADGWGITVYQEKNTIPFLYKSARSAAEDIDGISESFLSEKKYESGLAHLRKQTVGEVSLLNAHPFVEGHFSFIHNGTIGKDKDTYPELSSFCNGSTDSERVFRRFLELHKNKPLSVLSSFIKMIEETKELYPTYSAINSMLHDGTHIYISRVINKNNKTYESDILENYYTLYIGVTKDKTIVVSSEEIPYNDIMYTLLPNDSITKITLENACVETYQLR